MNWVQVGNQSFVVYSNQIFEPVMNIIIKYGKKYDAHMALCSIAAPRILFSLWQIYIKHSHDAVRKS